MKTIKIIFLLAITFAISTVSYGQGRHGGGGNHKGGHHNGGRNHHNGKVVVRRSHYHPHHVVVYHPGWRKNYSYNRRWIYFPKHNFYWDNWRNHYMFWNGTIWLSQSTPPPVIINVNLATEKHYELKENDDDVDDVYSSNPDHKTEYKPD